MEDRNKSDMEDLELFARLTAERKRKGLVDRSVRREPMTTFSIEPSSQTVKKGRVSKSKLQHARLAFACCAVACVSFVAGLKIQDHRTYLSAEKAVISELEQDIGGVLPEAKEEREIVYGQIAKDFDLSLTNPKDQEFLAYLMVVGRNDNEQAKTNFNQILKDYGYSTPQSFYASRGYFETGADEVTRPSGKVYENYMEARFTDHVEDVRSLEGGVRRH